MRLPGPLVSADWLAAHLDEVRVVDVRWYLDGRSGRAAYESGHLPGAVWADIDHDLAGPPTPEGGRHPLPSPEHFAAAMERLGIDNGDAVVAYDDASGSIAARLWWMLRSLGVEAAVLDGGLQAWPAALTSDEPEPRTARFAARPWPVDAYVDSDRVDVLRRDERALLVDARAAARFRGEDTGGVDRRPGHIPGGRSAPWADNVDASTGRLRAPDELRERYGALGAGEADVVVASCGSGVTACHDLLALHRAGLSGRLDPGSWSEWSANPELPIETA